MSIKNGPDVAWIAEYTWNVLDKLETNYNVKLPKPYVDDGAALAHCLNYIGAAYRNVPEADAAFVLCNKIQTRAWTE